MLEKILKSSVALPCAYLWRCPVCQARVVLMNTGRGLAFQGQQCRHAITPVMEGGVASVKYADPE